jgi:hypothetical protein
VAQKARRVFLSHASADRKLALRLKALLEKAVGAEVFCTSDVRDMEGGKPWFDQIMNGLKRASVCVALITPQSRFFSPWVAYESGAAYLRFQSEGPQSRLFPVCAHGFTENNVPSPWDELPVRNLADAEHLTTVLRDIAKKFRVKVNDAPEAVSRVLKASAGAPDWGNVSSALVSQRQDWSPFNFLSLLKQAKTQVFCAGFNLNAIASSQDTRDRLLTWLKNARKRSAHLLVADQTAADALADLGWVEARYLQDLPRSIAAFLAWKKEGTKRGIRREQLIIGRDRSFGLTVLAIDPDSRHGQMVLTPTIWGRPESPARPHFWLSRSRHKAVFEYYWDTYRGLFKRATPV